TRPATSARARTAPTSTEPSPSEVIVPGADAAVPETRSVATLAALRVGDLEVVGRLIGSSNNAMVVRVRPPGSGPTDATPPASASDDPDSETAVIELGPGELLAVWKPTRGEQPLFD